MRCTAEFALILTIFAGLLPIRSASAAEVYLPAGLEQDEIFAKAMARKELNQAALTSATGKGTWQAWLADGPQYIDSQFDISFAGKKYNMMLTFTRTPKSTLFYDRRHVISDGDLIAATRFSDRIHPSGCEVELYDTTYSSYLDATDGMCLQLSRLASAFYGPDFRDFKLEFRKHETDGTERYRLNRIQGKPAGIDIELVVDPALDHNIVRCTSLADSGKKAVERIIRWKKHGSVWWPQSFEWLEFRPAGAERPHRTLIEWASIEPNVPVAGDRFTLTSLEKCASARLVDRRPGIDPEKRFYRVDQLADAVASDEKLSSLASQVESLPVRPSGPPAATGPPPPPSKRAWLLWLLLIINCAAMLVYFATRFRARRRRT